MEQLETIAEKVGWLLKAEVEQQGGKILLKRQRTLEILAENNRFSCTLDLDISFEHLREDGSAFNKAEIFLLPEEFSAFTLALNEHRIPFPTAYRQWQESNPHLIRVCMESTEPPEAFAELLSTAMNILKR